MGSYTASATATFNGNNLAVSNPQGSRVDLSNIFLSNGFVEAGKEVTMYCMYEGSATVSIFTYQKQDSDGGWTTLIVDLDSRKTSTTLSSDALETAKSVTGKSGATSGGVATQKKPNATANFKFGTGFFRFFSVFFGFFLVFFGFFRFFHFGQF